MTVQCNYLLYHLQHIFLLYRIIRQHIYVIIVATEKKFIYNWWIDTVKRAEDAEQRTADNQLCQSHPSKSTKSLVIQRAAVDRLCGTRHIHHSSCHLPSTDNHPSTSNLKIIGMQNVIQNMNHEN